MSNHEPIEVHILELFRESAVPAGPSSHLVGATLDRLAAESRTDAMAGKPWAALRPAYVWKLTTVVVAVVVILGLVWFETGVNSANLAFAQVQQKVGKTRTVQFTEVRRRPDKKADLKEGVEEVDDSDAYHPRRYFISGRHLMRIEALDEKGKILHISISNAKSGKQVSIKPDEKKFVVLATQVTIDFDTGKTTERKIGPSPDADYTAYLSEVPAQATTKLPMRKIGDRQVLGFLWEEKIEKKQGTDTWKRTYWVDPKSQMIVQVEVSYQSTDPRVGSSDWVKSDFVFDQELPDSLFSTDPPKGYSVETQAIHGIQID
jgi:outer membrane lipoprotein-sorting protein